MCTNSSLCQILYCAQCLKLFFMITATHPRRNVTPSASPASQEYQVFFVVFSCLFGPHKCEECKCALLSLFTTHINRYYAMFFLLLCVSLSVKSIAAKIYTLLCTKLDRAPRLTSKGSVFHEEETQRVFV